MPAPPAYAVFFRDPNDVWSGPFGLGPAINSPGVRASSAYVSPDGRYLFFASTRLRPPEGKPGGVLTLDLLRRIHDAPGNGSSDIYWVDASVVHDLRPSGAGGR